MKKYLLRLDDASPFMDGGKWLQIEQTLDRYGVKPLVGVIPANADPQTMPCPEDGMFWTKVGRWQQKGWTVALHGYDHVCTTGQGGINPLWRRSEFAGVPLSGQKEKIKKGLAVFKANGITPRWFFAPSHTFDENTLTALLEQSTIRYVSDTMATRPYRMKNGIVVAPCQMGRFRDVPLSGYWTFCYHPNNMDDAQMQVFEQFVVANKEKFVSFDDLPMDTDKGKTVFDRLLSWAYFTMRRMRQR